MKKLRLLVLMLITLLSLAAPPITAQAAPCEAAGYPGYCFETLPRLHCCSAAMLGWSEIVVGDTFPVAGQVGRFEGQPTAKALQIRFPSGRTESLPVGTNGRFRATVSFSEEGTYRIVQVYDGGTTELGEFQVAYRAELVSGGMLAESQFGAQHARNGLSTVMVPAGTPATLRVRFADAKGEPVRSRTLVIGYGADQRFTTDADGIATITYDPNDAADGYRIDRLYPGLALISYREVTVEGDGLVTGLPGEEVRAFREAGRWYLPLKAFLESASPLRFGGQVLWNGETRTVQVEGLSLLIDTGLVLGHPDFRSDLRIVEGSTYMELHSLIRFMDQLGMAQRTGEFTFRLALAQVP